MMGLVGVLVKKLFIGFKAWLFCNPITFQGYQGIG